MAAHLQSAAEAAAACELDLGNQMFSRHPRLSIWDLRLVFPLGQAGSSAAIALRRGALLVAFPPMRAVLTATRCFVLLEEVGELRHSVVVGCAYFISESVLVYPRVTGCRWGCRAVAGVSALRLKLPRCGPCPFASRRLCLQSQFRERSSGEQSHSIDGKGAESERTPFPARVLAAMLDVTRDSLTHELARIRRRVSRVSNLGTQDSTVVEIE